MQYVEFKEASVHDPITASKIKKISELFPTLYSYDLMQVSVLFSTDGALASKVYRDDFHDVGPLLDYPCPEPPCDDPRFSYFVDFTATVDDEIVSDNVYNFVAEQDAYQELMAQRVVGLQTFFDCCEETVAMGLTNIKVSLRVESPSPTPDDCLDAVLAGGTPSVAHKVAIKNFLYNLCESDTAIDIILEIDWENKVHTGMVLTLLLLYKDDPTQPFWPFCLSRVTRRSFQSN
jgi:hypothetical protein